MKFKRVNFVVGGLALLVGGLAMHPLKERLSSRASAQDQPVKVGGYRTLAADCIWLETNLAWEARDAEKVRRLIDFTVTTDPSTSYFWLNGARVLAYDFPAWKGQFDGNAPMLVQTNWRAAGADEALQLLERGQQWHGKSAILHLEMANICLYALGDRPRAAEYYRRAAEQVDAPEYAARIYARLQAEEIAGLNP